MDKFCIFLTIAFIVLKLIGIIQWSWFWVLSPLIFLIAFIIVLEVVLFVLYTIVRR